MINQASKRTTTNNNSWNSNYMEERSVGGDSFAFDDSFSLPKTGRLSDIVDQLFLDSNDDIVGMVMLFDVQNQSQQEQPQPQEQQQEQEHHDIERVDLIASEERDDICCVRESHENFREMCLAVKCRDSWPDDNDCVSLGGLTIITTDSSQDHQNLPSGISNVDTTTDEDERCGNGFSETMVALSIPLQRVSSFFSIPDDFKPIDSATVKARTYMDFEYDMCFDDTPLAVQEAWLLDELRATTSIPQLVTEYQNHYEDVELEPFEWVPNHVTWSESTNSSLSSEDGKVQDADTTKFKHWTEEEDNRLKYAVEREYTGRRGEKKNWKMLAREYFNNTRSSGQCKIRWKHVSWSLLSPLLLFDYTFPFNTLTVSFSSSFLFRCIPTASQTWCRARKLGTPRGRGHCYHDIERGQMVRDC
jgi:hypothetical protein